MTAGKSKRSQSPPLSPVLLLGFLARPLPISGLQPFLNLAIDRMHKTHADVFDRMAGRGEMVFLIDPIDLPFAFELTIAPSKHSLIATQRPAALPDHIDAAIRGSLMSLIALIEGRVDGDALFFSRELIIEGDTEAVLVLRNAVDGADIDIVEDMTSIIPAFSKPARAVVDTAQALFARMSADLNTAATSLQAPLQRRMKTQSTEIKRQNERLDEMAQTLRRNRKASS